MSAPSRSRLPSLTGLRFLAALSVFCFHITLSSSPISPNDPVNPFGDKALADGLEHVFTKAGYLGVSFFFVLSGFVIAWSYRPGEPHRAFLRRRLVKLFPNHLMMWTAAMALFAAAITTPAAYLTNLLLFNSHLPDAAVYVTVNPPSWTLGSELLFYLLFPLLFALVLRIPVRRLGLAAGAMVLGVLAVAAITQWWIPDTPRSPLTPVSTTQFWFGYIFPPSRLFEFVLGLVLARMVLTGAQLRLPLWSAFVLCLAGYGLAMVVPFTFSFTAAMVVPIAVLIVVAAGRDVDGAPFGLREPADGVAGQRELRLLPVPGRDNLLDPDRGGQRDLLDPGRGAGCARDPGPNPPGWLGALQPGRDADDAALRPPRPAPAAMVERPKRDAAVGR